MVESREKAVKDYNELMKKYKLPALDELEDEFDFELYETSGIISHVNARIWDKILKIKNDIEGIFNPQQYCCLIEHKFFNDREQKELFNVYTELMIKLWEATRAGYINKDENAKQLITSYEYYKKVKEFAKKFYTKFVDKWGEKGEKELREEYIS